MGAVADFDRAIPSHTSIGPRRVSNSRISRPRSPISARRSGSTRDRSGRTRGVPPPGSHWNETRKPRQITSRPTA
jgi:hypothetical protein